MDLTSYLLGKKSSGGGGLDWTAIGYTQSPKSISDGYTYAKQIYDNWDVDYGIPTYSAMRNIGEVLKDGNDD